MLKNSLIRSFRITFNRPALVQPSHRKSVPISYYTTRSRSWSIINIIRTIVSPLSFISQSILQPQKASQELESQALSIYEKIKLPIIHTFNRTPRFLGREKEIRILNELLSGDARFLVVNGSKSVGKTALLREVLTDDRYHVIYIDLRISGFADLRSFTADLASLLELFFTRISSYYPNLKIFEDKAIAFRSLRLGGPESYKKKLLQQSEGVEMDVDLIASQNRSDLAKLMEKLQAGLLMYHKVNPDEKTEKNEVKIIENFEKYEKDKYDKYRIFDYDKDSRRKRIPIIVFDEAHKLRYLLNDNDALQILFDALVVLTTQDRLCHVIHITSNAFYERLLAQKNILHHTKSLVIGDLSQSEISKYFHKVLTPSVPQEIRQGIFKMEVDLHKILGGRILDWKSFVQDYILSDGNLTIESFEPFIRAKHQLNLLSKDLPTDDEIPGNPIKRISRYIIASPMHKVPYHRLCKEFTQPVIDMLIDNEILGYRLIDEIDNVDDAFVERPFVIPSSHLMKHAMEVFLEKN